MFLNFSRRSTVASLSIRESAREIGSFLIIRDAYRTFISEIKGINCITYVSTHSSRKTKWTLGYLKIQ